MNRVFLLFLMMVPAVSTLPAQTGYSYTYYTTDNGLTSNGVKGMYFDSTSGFLWIATEAGLTRFNGNTFRNFDAGNPGEVITDRMLFLFADMKNNVYAVDTRSRIFSIQKNKAYLFDSMATVPAGRIISSIAPLYISENMYRTRVTHPANLASTAPGYDRIMAVSDTAGIIVRPGTSAIRYFSISRPEPIPLPITVNKLQTCFSIGNHYFIVDSAASVFELDPHAMRLKRAQLAFNSLPGDIIIWQKTARDPICFSGKKAYTLWLHNGVIRRDEICNSLPGYMNIRFAQYNRAIKTLFIGTESRGIVIIRENALATILPQKRSHNQVESFYTQIALPNGNILTSDGQQLGKSALTKNIPVKGSYGRFLLHEGDSITWYLQERTLPGKPSLSYLHRYHSKTNTTLFFPKIQIPFQSPLQKSDGNLYAYTENGLFRMEGDSIVPVNKKLKTINGGIPFHLFEIRPGVLVMARHDYLLRYDIYTEKTDTLLKSPDASVRALWMYDDYLFIGTYGKGIYVYHNGIIKPLPVDRNRHLMFANCFMPDEYGYCWISSNNGLFKVSISDMIHAYENNTDILYYHYYGKADGMAITEMNGGCIPCAVRKNDKTISFPTMSGLVWVNPSTAQPGLNWNHLYLDAMSADGKWIPLNSPSIKLPENTREIQVYVAAAVWENPENTFIQYRLGDSDTWQWVDISGKITIPGPGYGKHHLFIRKINGFGQRNTTMVDLYFIIRTPIYAAWWFYVLLGLTGISLVCLILRVRTKRYMINQQELENLVNEKIKELRDQHTELEKRDAVKTRLISIINHDIITPLRFLSATGRNLIEKRKMMDEKTQDEIIFEMTHTSRELQVLSTNILNWIKYQGEGKGLVKDSFKLYDTADRILKVLSAVANMKQLKTVIDIDPELEVYQYYDPLKVLIYNLVSNSIKFTQKGSVVIGADEENGYVTLWVADEGMGMTETQIQNLLLGKTHIHSIKKNPGTRHGLGYQIIRDLLQITDAAIDIKSVEGNGTTVLVRFRNEEPAPEEFHPQENDIHD